MSVLDLFRRAEPSDGAAPELERIAAESSGATGAPSSSSRRERGAEVGDDVVAETLGAKVLHGWLQNRHQTLMPLSLNMSVLSSAQQTALAAILASLLLAGRPDAHAVASGLRDWLAGLGASEAAKEAFDQALEAPLPLNALFDLAHRDDLSIYTYVAALIASDPRFPVSVMLCDLVQARFELPNALVRSAVRRYRR